MKFNLKFQAPRFTLNIWEILLLLVETIPPIPQEGDTFHEFTTRENYPPSPLQKNKVNHINKIIMTKLSLMHPCLFSKKYQFVLRI